VGRLATRRQHRTNTSRKSRERRMASGIMRFSIAFKVTNQAPNRIMSDGFRIIVRSRRVNAKPRSSKAHSNSGNESLARPWKGCHWISPWRSRKIVTCNKIAMARTEANGRKGTGVKGGILVGIREKSNPLISIYCYSHISLIATC
jgi:hypothetical protein